MFRTVKDRLRGRSSLYEAKFVTEVSLGIAMAGYSFCYFCDCLAFQKSASKRAWLRVSTPINIRRKVYMGRTPQYVAEASLPKKKSYTPDGLLFFLLR